MTKSDLADAVAARTNVPRADAEKFVDQVFAAEAAGERRPLPVLVEQRQDQPAAVPAFVVISDRVERPLARTPLLEFRAT